MQKVITCAPMMLAISVLLSGCFLVPGAFVASMDVRRDGSFNFAYQGEMIFLTQDDLMRKNTTKTWSDGFARCFTDKDPYYDEYSRTDETAAGAASAEAEAIKAADPDTKITTYESGERPCKKEEIAKVKAQFDEQQEAANKRKETESAQFAALFGFNPTNDDANRKFAAAMMKYEGWKSVTYKGKGVFQVDYQIKSQAGHDYIFPVIPQGDFLVPFVALRKREGGTLGVNAPALVGGGLKALAMRGEAMGRMTPPELSGLGQRTQGTFTLTTDGEIVTNNTEDGPTTDGKMKKLVWEIGAESDKIPEALIRLK